MDLTPSTLHRIAGRGISHGGTESEDVVGKENWEKRAGERQR